LCRDAFRAVGCSEHVDDELSAVTEAGIERPVCQILLRVAAFASTIRENRPPTGTVESGTSMTMGDARRNRASLPLPLRPTSGSNQKRE
jgi:hypothetical protein